MSVTVEAASGEDVAAVTELWVALAREQRDHGSHLLAAENRQQARDLIGQYVHADGVAVARSVDATGGVRREGASGRRDGAGAVVGFVMFHVETGYFETDATRGVVENVYVVPDARGEGVGSALLDYAEAELAARGADAVAVEALWGNEAVRRLYERRGYEPQRVTLEREVRGDGGGDGATAATDPDDTDAE